MIVEFVLDMIISWEIRRSDHASKKEAMDCIMKNVSKDIELKNWILQRLDRGFLYKLKQWFFSVIHEPFFHLFRFLCAAGSTLCFYWDIVKDVITFILLNHVSSKILVSSNLKPKFDLHSLHFWNLSDASVWNYQRNQSGCDKILCFDPVSSQSGNNL